MPYGSLPYTGNHPVVITPSQDEIGVPFLVGNDRYQVVVCADSGTSASNPSWRYWYAGGAPWGEIIAQDINSPTFHVRDEAGDPVMGQVEFSFREFKMRLRRASAGLFEATIDGVLVEFTPMPLIVDPSAPATVMVGFSGHVEAHGQVDLANVTGSQITGVTVSSTFSHSEELHLQPSDPWPNTRTVFLPVRLQGYYRSARIILTGIHLVEINEVTLLGNITPARPV